MAKKLKWNLILMSVLYLGLGIFLLMRPSTALNVVCYALGGVVLETREMLADNAIGNRVALLAPFLDQLALPEDLEQARAEATPELSGRSLERAERALARIVPPSGGFDLVDARAELEAAMGDRLAPIGARQPPQPGQARTAGPQPQIHHRAAQQPGALTTVQGALRRRR